MAFGNPSLVPLAFIPPLLPTLIEKPPGGGRWQHEVKFDGYRTQILVEGGKARLFTRNGHDWTTKYRAIAAAAVGFGLEDGVLDGEVIVTDAEGKPDFKSLPGAIRSHEQDLVFMAFDLLHLNGHDLRRMALEERRHILENLIEPEHNPIRFSEALHGDGDAIYRAADRMGLEGIVSKRLDSRYVSGRSNVWLKIKCYDEADFNVIGVQRERGKLAMALMADQQGRYVGAAFVTLPSGIRQRLWKRVKEKAGAPAPKGMPAGKAKWVKPGTIARVRFLKGEEKLRHATVKDVREE